VLDTRRCTWISSRSHELDALKMVSSSSSTNTPTGSAPYDLATLDISLASDNGTERLELGQRIIPISLGPAFAAIAASLADVMPHILTTGSFLLPSSKLDDKGVAVTVCLAKQVIPTAADLRCPAKDTEYKN
jgi:hypothetical protein